MKIWIDLTILPHVHFFRALTKRLVKSGHELLVTSREFDMMDGMLEKNGIEHVNVGRHGGKGLESKLIRSSERVKDLARLISKECPDVGLSKHSVECARVCFGLGVPSVTVIDHETAEKQSRLIVPLSKAIVSPRDTPQEVLRKFGARDVFSFRGVCEIAHFYDFKPSEKVLEDNGVSRDGKVVIARSEPMLSSHNFGKSAVFDVLREIRSEADPQIVFVPRNEADAAAGRKEGLIVPGTDIDTLSLYHFADMMIGAGSCMNRESCVSGCPTISICPDRLPGVDRFLVDSGLMFHSTGKDEIVGEAMRILREGKGERSKDALKDFEDPYGKIMEAVGAVVKK